MTTHELKLDVKYFDDVLDGKKNFEIRKNDRDYQVGDILELRAYKKYKDIEGYAHKVNDFEVAKVNKDLADIVRAKVVDISTSECVNACFKVAAKLEVDFNDNYFGTGNGIFVEYSDVEKVLNDYFGTFLMPEGYVLLGIEVFE